VSLVSNVEMSQEEEVLLACAAYITLHFASSKSKGENKRWVRKFSPLLKLVLSPFRLLCPTRHSTPRYALSWFVNDAVAAAAMNCFGLDLANVTTGTTCQ
jgi:hypothetical protein